MKYLIATAFLTVGVSIPAEAADLPNPQVGECVHADAVVTRTEPTMINPEGRVLGIRIWQACGYQVPTGVGSQMRAVDDVFWTDIDLDGVDPAVAEAVAEVLGS